MSQLSEAPQAKENLEASKLTNPKDVGVDEGLNSLNEDPKEKFDDLVKDLKNLAGNTNNINYINMLGKKNELSRSNYGNVQTGENGKLLNIKQTLSSGLVTENKLVLLDNGKFLLYEGSYTKEQVGDDGHGNKTTPSTKQVEKVNDKNVDKFLSNFERKINNRQKKQDKKDVDAINKTSNSGPETLGKVEIKDGIVYYNTVKIKGADPKSFQLINHYYSKDKNNVFFNGVNMGRIKINSSILEEFDAKTFEISKTNEGETILKDKNGIYEGDASTGFKKIEEKNNK